MQALRVRAGLEGKKRGFFETQRKGQARKGKCLLGPYREVDMGEKGDPIKDWLPLTTGKKKGAQGSLSPSGWRCVKVKA